MWRLIYQTLFYKMKIQKKHTFLIFPYFRILFNNLISANKIAKKKFILLKTQTHYEL